MNGGATHVRNGIGSVRPFIYPPLSPVHRSRFHVSTIGTPWWYCPR